VRHVDLNDLAAVVRAVPTAIGDREGSAGFLVARTAGEGRLAGETERHRAALRVPVTTIDAFCARERLDPRFIKIDVEGAELAVLRGARETIRRAGRRLALFVEWQPSVWPALGVGRADIEAELARQGLDLQPLADGDPWAVEGIAVRLVPR
jgi:FkbM family methyltransferase